MPGFWIDLETPAGVRLGSGPITGALDWEWTPRLDGAGTFSFTVPASDPQTTYLTGGCVVRCRAIRSGAVVDHGMGIVRKIERIVGDPTMLRVSGPDILAELMELTVHNLAIREQAWSDLTNPLYGKCSKIIVARGGATANGEWEIVNCYDGNDATGGAMNMARDVDPAGFPEANTWFYVGADARWDRVDWTLLGGGRVNERDSHSRAQYYNGSGWVDEAIVSDGTVGGNGWSFEQSGIMTFARPADWARYVAEAGAGNWFWRRFGVTVASGNEAIGALVGGAYIDIAEVDVYADIPTVTGPELIMHIATVVAAGWTIDPDPCSTVWPKYLIYNGESVLTALLMLAEQGGVDAGQAIREHFRLGTGRVVEWLGITEEATGLRAVSVRDPISALGAPELVLITEGGLTETEDTSEVVTRVYGYSGDGISLALSDRTPPAGYTEGHVHIGVDTYYYVQHTAGFGLYGLVELVQRFSDLTMQQADSLTAHPTFVANAVYDRAVELLRTHAVVNMFYSLDVVQFPVFLKPGQLIDVVYHEYTDTLHTVDIDTVKDGAPLWILAPTLRITQDGVWTTGLEVATIDRYAQSDAGVVVDLVRERDRAAGNMGNISIIGGIGASTPPSAGPDIRVSGYQVSRAGAGVLLFSGSGLVLAEYAATEAGLIAAFAASASGDGVEVPNGTLTLAATLAVPAGRFLRGRGASSIVNGYITLGVGAYADNFENYQSVNTADDIVGISGPGAAGKCYVRDVYVKLIQAGSGKALGLLATGSGGEMHVYGETIVEANGGTGSRWAYAEADSAKLYYHHGSVKAWIGA